MKLLLIKLVRLVCYLVRTLWAIGAHLYLLEIQHMFTMRLGLLVIPENKLLIYSSPPAIYITSAVLVREQDSELDSYGFKLKVYHLRAVFLEKPLNLPEPLFLHLQNPIILLIQKCYCED